MTIFSTKMDDQPSRPARWELRGLGNGPRAFGFHGPGGRFRRSGTRWILWWLGPTAFFSTIEKRQFDVEYLVEYIYIYIQWKMENLEDYSQLRNIHTDICEYIYGSYPWNSIMTIYCMEYISSFGSKIHNFPRGFCDARPDQFQSLVLWGVGSEG